MYWKYFQKASVAAALCSFFGSVLSAPQPHDIQGQPAKRQGSPKLVFAHFMIGIVQNYTPADFKIDMAYAMEIGIDAFALNCASIDSYTPTQLANAYQAAQEIGFKVFISFDFAYWNNGDTAKIAAYMQQYAGHPAAMQYNGGGVVSTFVGDSFNWQPVKDATSHSIFAIPMMQDPIEATYEKTAFDGAFSWLAWPTDGGNSIIPGPMTTIWDDRFVVDLAGKPYMARKFTFHHLFFTQEDWKTDFTESPNLAVSPWFSTHFNSKNWVFICEQLITDRWWEMLALKPQLIEIITWNDYGESHYIGPAEPNHTDDGSSQWAAGFPHDGWRIIMKPFIAAYKAGLSTPSVYQDQLVYWYRPTPKGIHCTNDPLGPPNGIQYLQDLIFVTTLLTSPAQLTVTSGANAPMTINVAAGIVTSNFTMGVGAQSFSVTRNGRPVLSGMGGKDIVNTCVYYNFNAYVGSINGTGVVNPPPPPSTTSTTSMMMSTSTSISTMMTSTSTISTSIMKTSTTSTSTSTTSTLTSTSTTSTTSITSSTSTTSSTKSTSSSPTNPSPVCIAGTGPGNYVGLCQFCCSYGYCPPGPCTCTAMGNPVPTPPTTGTNGCPAYGEDNSYLGLCSFSCSHGYCPPTACRVC